MITNQQDLNARINAFMARKSAQHPDLDADTSRLGIERFIEKDASKDASTSRWNSYRPATLGF